MDNTQAPAFTWGPEAVSARALLTSTVMLLLLATAYLYGVVQLSRDTLWFEGAISLAFPLLAWRGGWFTDAVPRLYQLLAFESVFNALALLNQVSLQQGFALGATFCGWAIAAWFLLQVAGFVMYQREMNRTLGVLQSLLLLGFIAAWFFRVTDVGGAIDSEGRFLLWGTDAPLVVQLAYAVWFLNATLGDPHDIHYRQFLLQGTSVAVALASGEFFHARILTASHLFAVDLVFAVGKLPSPIPPDQFAQLTIPTRRWLFEEARPWLVRTCAVVLVGIALWALSRGGVG